MLELSNVKHAKVANANLVQHHKNVTPAKEPERKQCVKVLLSCKQFVIHVADKELKLKNFAKVVEVVVHKIRM